MISLAKNSPEIQQGKSEVFDCQRLPIFFIAFLASFWRDRFTIKATFELSIANTYSISHRVAVPDS